jgi:hypothetical protein
MAKPTVLRIDGEAETIRVDFTKGEGSGAGYVARFSDSVTLRDEVDEEGEPIPEQQFWSDFVAGTEIAAYIRAQPSAITNGAALQKLANHFLSVKGVI